MVLLYQPNKPNKQPKFLQAKILDLDYQGLGLAKINGKTWFIENALPQELVEFRCIEEKRQYGLGVTKNILTKHPQRQTPRCSLYEKCGGCQSQHIPLQWQQEAKQKALWRRLSKLQPEVQLMPMLSANQWNYRRRSRLSLWFDSKTQRLAMGFRQRNSQQIINVNQCEVLEPALNQILPALQSLLSRWSTPKALGHIEIVAADNGVALLLRHVKSLCEQDRILLLNFAHQHRLMLFVQTEDKIEHWYGEQPFYCLNPNLRLYFDVRDFIQVNTQLNQLMVQTALDWLDLNNADQVLDLFCGMGNFTFPISKRVARVVGIEGVAEMVVKAQNNTQLNHCHNAEFYQADLTQSFQQQSWAQQTFTKILLDPPRAGAAFALEAICQLQAQKILYVSCNPATLVRDTEILLQAGYRLCQVAMIDMFPNTGHLEAMTLFERK